MSGSSNHMEPAVAFCRSPGGRAAIYVNGLLWWDHPAAQLDRDSADLWTQALSAAMPGRRVTVLHLATWYWANGATPRTWAELSVQVDALRHLEMRIAEAEKLRDEHLRTISGLGDA